MAHPVQQQEALTPEAYEDLRRSILRVDALLAKPPVRMTPELLEQFLTWSLDERHNTLRYVREQRAYLTWWSRIVGDADLRGLSLLEVVQPALAGAKARGARIAALKAFCAWLVRERFLLERNPVDALKVPQSRPEQWRRPKVVQEPHRRAVLEQLEPHWRDAILVLSGTGWHVTELDRFARAGAVAAADASVRSVSRRARVAGVLVTQHKHGETSRTPVSARVLAAAQRVRGRTFSTAGLRRALARAAARAGVERWTAGRMRHTVATHAVRAGASLEAVSEFLHHKDRRTTRRFYVWLYTPRKVPTPA